MIEARHIIKRYGSLTVLQDVSVSIGQGEIVSIVGPSGAGKTTLLQIIGTLDKPDEGQVLYDGTDVLRLKDKEMAHFRNRNIGFVFQFHQLLPEFTMLENVEIPALIGGMKHGEAVKILSDKAMVSLPLKRIYSEVGFASPTTFYKLFQQQVGITPHTYRKQFLEMDHDSSHDHNSA